MQTTAGLPTWLPSRTSEPSCVPSVFWKHQGCSAQMGRQTAASRTAHLLWCFYSISVSFSFQSELCTFLFSCLYVYRNLITDPTTGLGTQDTCTLILGFSVDTWQVLESLTSFHKGPHLNHCPSILFCTEIYLKHTVSSFSNIVSKHQAHDLSFQTLKPRLWFGGIFQKVQVLFESAPSDDFLQVFFFFLNIYLFGCTGS